MTQILIKKLLDAVTTTTTGSMKDALKYALRTFQAVVAGTGAVTATVEVQVSLDNSNWLTLATITLSGTTSASDGYVSEAPWPYVRGKVTAISGTSAAVTLYMGGFLWQ